MRTRALHFCAECRAAAGELHAEECPATIEQGNGVIVPLAPVNIPLHVQERIFDHEAQDAADDLAEMLTHEADEIIALARERLRDGFAEYGSTMYEWQPAERRRNLIEELADAVVYWTSGPIREDW